MTDVKSSPVKEVVFRVDAWPGKRQELLDFLLWDKQKSEADEPGTLRFDVFEDPHIENRLYVIEAYTSDGAFQEHKQHEPYTRWTSAEFQTSVVSSHSDLRPVVTSAGSSQIGD
jgi:quinol monooxygenase YgiN